MGTQGRGKLIIISQAKIPRTEQTNKRTQAHVHITKTITKQHDMRK